jgi:hypothetical protein
MNFLASAAVGLAGPQATRAAAAQAQAAKARTFMRNKVAGRAGKMREGVWNEGEGRGTIQISA